MENSICNLLESNSAKEFISALNSYGECIDYSSDYERSRSRNAIFVGVVNKVYKSINKGEGQNDTLFISAKSFVNVRRESQPFRIGFVGDIVHQLTEAGLKEGDAIGILKPKFFYALDIPSLSVGTKNVVVWIGKNVKDSQVSTDIAKSSSESQNCKGIDEQRSNTENMRKRRIIMDNDSDCISVDESSTLSTGTLKRNVQIYRSKPVDLNKISVNKPSAKSKLIPDSTTKSVVNKDNEKNLNKKSDLEVELAGNIVSQNTAINGSADVPLRNKNVFNHFLSKCNSPEKYVQRNICCSHDNYGHNTCGITNSHQMCCECRLPCSNDSGCNCQTTSGNHMLEECSCYARTCCECSYQQHCECNRIACCCHHKSSCNHCDSAHSCHSRSCSFNTHFNHSCRKKVQSQFNRMCIQHCCLLDCQSSSTNLKKLCPRSNHTFDKHISNKRMPSCNSHNFCSSGHRNGNAIENTRLLKCSIHRNNSNSPTKCTTSEKYIERNKERELSVSEYSIENSRIKRWVDNLTQNPPCLVQSQSEKPESESNDQSFRNPSSFGEIEERLEIVDSNNTVVRQGNEKSKYNSSSYVAQKSIEKINAKKKKLFCPMDNSSIISERTIRSVYNDSTIVEESTPFSSESHNNNLASDTLPPEEILRPTSNINNSSEQNIELSLSNTVIDNYKMNDNTNISVSGANIQTKNQEKESSAAAHIDSEIVLNINCSNEKNNEVSPTTENCLSQGLNNPSTIQQSTNQTSSEEQFPELQIDSPIISETELPTNENRQERLPLVHDTDSQKDKESNESENRNLENKSCENAKSKEIINDKETVNSLNSDIIMESDNEDTTIHNHVLSESDKKSLNNDTNIAMSSIVSKESTITINNIKTNENVKLGARSSLAKTYKSSSSTVSLSLSDYSKSKSSYCDNNETVDMELTVPNHEAKNNINKRKSVEIKNSDEADEVMEFTCESRLMKRKRRNGSVKSISSSIKTPSSGDNLRSNVRDFSVSSSGTFLDAQSITASQTSNKWCLKPVDEIFENEKVSFQTKILQKFGLTCSSYNLNLFSTFEVIGTIINILPSISAENYGAIVKGFCNEGCRKEYTYEDYKNMKELNEEYCTFCRYRYHIACPGCLTEGLSKPLCLYYSFELHLLDGRNVFRVEVEHQYGVTFMCCTPQLYLKTDRLFKQINKLIVSSSPSKWTNAVLLKAKIKVMPKLGEPVLTIQGSSLKKDLTLKGKHYKFCVSK